MARKRDSLYNWFRALRRPIGHSDSGSTSDTPVPEASSSRSGSPRGRQSFSSARSLASAKDLNATFTATSEGERATTHSALPEVDAGSDNESGAKSPTLPVRDDTQLDGETGSAPQIPAIEVSGVGAQYPRWDSSDEARSIVYPDLGADNHTRLITIEREDPDDHRLKCTSEAVPLHDDVAYDALSYAWGTEELSDQIILNGYIFPVRRTLYQALLTLRRLQVPKAWVDNLSIDQDSITDKDRQISRMHVIYSHADTVYAWIGERIEPGPHDARNRKADGQAGVTFLGRTLPTRAFAENEILAVQDVVARPYWTRCWIIQELCRSKKALVLCGQSQADFSDFWSNLEAFQKTTGDAWVEEDLRVHFDSLKAFQKQESARTREPRMPLIKALLLSRYSEASVPRDKIFAILNLAHDSDKLIDTPNYRQADNEVLWKLTHNMVHLQGHVSVVLLARRELSGTGSPFHLPTDTAKPRVLDPASARNRGRRAVHQRLNSLSSQDVRSFIASDRILPSWVPYWPKLDDPLPWWVQQSVEDTRPRTQSKHSELDISHEGSVLRIRGVLLENVESTSGIPGAAKYNAPQPNGPPTALRQDETDLPLEMTLSRRSSMKSKQFSNASEVARKLWEALLAPVCAEEGKEIPPVTHECNSFACGNNEDGYACASVLMRTGSAKRKAISRWVTANRSLRIGDRDLSSWMNELLEADSSPSDYGTTSGRDKRRSQQTFCDFATEAEWLERAFQSLERYKMRLAVTSRCTFKLVYREAGPGDAICRLDGCSLPVILRAVPEKPTESSLTFQNFDLPSMEPQPEFSSVALGRSSSSGNLFDGVVTTHQQTVSPHRQSAGALHQNGSPSIPQATSRETVTPTLTSHPAGPTSQMTRDDSYATLPPRESHGSETWQYIGEVYRHQHLHSSWADPSRTGWKDSHFSQGNWEDFRIV